MESLTIGPCTLYCGDCREILPTLPKVDCVVTDPPYGIRLKNHCAGQCWDGTRRQGRTPLSWSITGDESHEIADAIKDWCKIEKVPVAMFGSAFKPYSGEWRNILVWNKGAAVGGGGDPSKCWKRTHELIFIANNGPLRNSRDGSVLNFPVTSRDFKFHPAQKPVALLRYLIEQMTDRGDTVVDPCNGSGSTMLACAASGRRGVGIEVDKKHFDTACQRLESAVRQVQLELIPA